MSNFLFRFILFLFVTLFCGCTKVKPKASFNTKGVIKRREVNATYYSTRGDSIGYLTEEVLFQKGGAIKSVKYRCDLRGILTVSSYKNRSFSWSQYCCSDETERELLKSVTYTFRNKGTLNQVTSRRRHDKHGTKESFSYDSKGRVTCYRVENEENERTEYRYSYTKKHLKRVEIERQYRWGEDRKHDKRIYNINEKNLPFHETFIDILKKDTSSQAISIDTSELFTCTYDDREMKILPDCDFYTYLMPLTIDCISNLLVDLQKGTFHLYNGSSVSYNRSHDSLITVEKNGRNHPTFTKIHSETSSRQRGTFVREATISYDYF